MIIDLQTPDSGPVIPRSVIVPARYREVIAFHCAQVHCNLAALENSATENMQYHLDEHFGCGGIRNHDWASFHFDPERLEADLEEYERTENYGWTTDKLPDGSARNLHWRLNRIGHEFRPIGGH